jgi:hypothetical protein
VVPTPERVERLAATVDLDAGERLFELDTRHGLGVTVQAAAVNAVMAGCRPERAASALLDEVALMARTGCHLNWLHEAATSDSSFYRRRPFLFVTGREHTRVLTEGGLRAKEAVALALYERLTRPDPVLRPAAVATPDNIHVVYVHATGMQQSWFFAPFQSHQAVLCAVGDRRTAG